MESMMKACPRFEKCSANICPLDPLWRKRVHREGEPICGLAREAVKDGADRRLEGYIPQEMLAEVRRTIPQIMARWVPIQKGLERAAISGSKMDARAPWLSPKDGE
jgi:hypothetical protein